MMRNDKLPAAGDVPDERRRPARARPRRRRWLRRLAVVLVLLVVVIAALPWLVATPPLRDALLSRLVAGDTMRIDVGSASLGWFTPPALEQVDLRDAAGAPLLTVESIRLNRTPLALLFDRRRLGQLELLRPTIYLAIGPEGTNLEAALKPLLERVGLDHPDQPLDDEAEPPPVELVVRVVDGTILANDTVSGRRWRASGLNLEYDPGGGGPWGRMSASGRLETLAAGSDQPEPAGQIHLELAAGDDHRQQFQFQAQSLALLIVDPWLRHFATGAELRGALDGTLRGSWSPPTAAGNAARRRGATIAAEGELRITGFEAAAPALAGDRLRVDRVELSGRATTQPTGPVAMQLELRSALGRLSLQGTVDPQTLGHLARADVAAAAGNHLEVAAEVNLPPLAAMLPNTLRIRRDTTITGGTVELQATLLPHDPGQAVTGSLRTTGLAGTASGRPLRWDEPVQATFDLLLTERTARLQSLTCQSDFLRIDAAGTPQQLTASAEFDLNRLAIQLGQFIDLSRVELAGTGTAHLDWHRREADQFVASANTELRQLQLALGDAVWREPRLAVEARAAGTLDARTQAPATITTASAELEAEADRLAARLTGPVRYEEADVVWPLSLQATGSLAGWLTRLRPWLPLDGWQIEGHGELSAQARLANHTIEVADATLTVANLRARSERWSVQETRVELTGDGRWDAASGTLASPSARLVSSTLALAAKDVRLRTAARHDPQLSGTAAWRVDLGRLATWQAGSPDYRPQGMLSGNLRFEQQGSQITGQLTADGQDLALFRTAVSSSGRAASLPVRPASHAANASPQPLWQEAAASLRGTVAYDAAADRLACEQCEIHSDTLTATLAGSVARLSTAAEVDLHGTADYDLARLTPWLQSYFGRGIRLAGRDAARFELAGPLADLRPVELRPVGEAQHAAPPAEHLRARFEAPWNSANVYGLPIGDGKLVAELRNGTVSVEPLSVAVAEGRLTLAPRLRLSPGPAQVTLPRGPVLTKVNISPEVSHEMLKYIAPVLAGVTRTEGKFSLELAGAKVPLDNPRQADMAGQLAVHAVRVTPGPVADQWIGLAQQIEAIAKRRDPAALARRPAATLLAIDDQQVGFHVADGRVFHQSMEFQVDDVRIRSEGSVGFDESLALVLHVPIQDQWVDGRRWLAGLKGQSLDIPVSGTLTRPRMDQSAVAGLSQQLLQGAAQQALGNELNHALDKLFKPR